MRRAKILLYPAVALAVAACERGTDVHLPAAPLDLVQPCEVEAGCVAAADDLSMRFTLGPGLRALSPFPVLVELQSDRQVDSVIVAFAMKGMDMGPNRYRLISDGADRWLGNATLPVCSSGRSDWLARFEVTAEGRRFMVEAPFKLSQ
ncbi:MAG: hypothetical protein PVG38_14875 [Gammaproteobacteria bacterium]|jgi:hypothetical protein